MVLLLLAYDDQRPARYRELDRDFFDLIVVDECHRGSAREDYARTRAGVIWLLTLYAKNEAENISAHTLRRIAKEIEDGQS